MLLETALVVRSNGLEPLLESVRRELRFNDVGTASVERVDDLSQHTARPLPK
jgi:hypothetical protein